MPQALAETVSTVGELWPISQHLGGALDLLYRQKEKDTANTTETAQLEASSEEASPHGRETEERKEVQATLSMGPPRFRADLVQARVGSPALILDSCQVVPCLEFSAHHGLTRCGPSCFVSPGARSTHLGSGLGEEQPCGGQHSSGSRVMGSRPAEGRCLVCGKQCGTCGKQNWGTLPEAYGGYMLLFIFHIVPHVSGTLPVL